MIELRPARPGSTDLNAVQAAALLNLSRHPAASLRASGYLPNLDAAAVMDLAGRPYVASSDGIPVLRPGRPGRDGARRTGHQRSDDDDTLLESLLQKWGGPVEQTAEIGFMAVSVAGFIVAVLRLDGIAEYMADAGYQRVRFSGTLVGRLDDLYSRTYRSYTESPLCEQLLGYRVNNPPGGPLTIVSD